MFMITAQVRPRLQALEAWGYSEKDQVITDIGNRSAHGGDMVSDIEAILFSEEEASARVEGYKAAFQDAYGISFDEAKGYGFHVGSRQYPGQLLETCDIRATAKKMPSWRHATNRVQVVQLASKIILHAQNADASKRLTCFQQGEMKDDFDRLLSLYTSA